MLATRDLAARAAALGDLLPLAGEVAERSEVEGGSLPPAMLAAGGERNNLDGSAGKRMHATKPLSELVAFFRAAKLLRRAGGI